MYFNANAGHVGCSLSCAEIITFIRFFCMQIDQTQKSVSSVNDTFILSKGHAAACLYSMLAEAGDLSEDDINSFYKDGTLLAAHPPPNQLPHVPFATGSLGHGLSLSAGVAFANQMLGSNSKVFCLISDGELNEGSIWEAVLFSAQFKLNSLTLFVDRNGIQGFGRTEEVMALGSIEDKFTAFGWNVFNCNGHSFNSLNSAKNASEQIKNQKPTVIICKTIKGNGLIDLSDTVDCHYLPMTPEQFEIINLSLNLEEAELNEK